MVLLALVSLHVWYDPREVCKVIHFDVLVV